MIGLAPWRAAATTVMAVLAGACLTACVQVPDAGPVVKAREPAQGSPVDNPYNNPPPPARGATPEQIVTGFFDAMTATPLQTRAAQKYLLSTGNLWQPQRSVITYSRLRTATRGDGRVVVRLAGGDLIGAAGQWQGRLTPGASRITFPMRRENGEWRIAAAPDALIVPRTFYETAFQPSSVYFFDPSGRILVPEVVHVPSGSQLTTSLMQALVRGPRPLLGGVVRSYIPPGLTVAPVVVSGGVADVTLQGPAPRPLSSTSTRLMLAQLAWTLRQDPTVQAFEVSIAGNQVTDGSGSSTFRVDNADALRYDPAVPQGSSQLYALRRGLLVSGRTDHLTANAGPFGTTPQGIGAFAVSLDDGQVAGLTGSALLLGPVLGSARPVPVMTGPGLLRPAWDFAGRLWEVQNDPGGATVSYYTRGRVHTVRVPGVTGADVTRFLISRDGSRLVAVLRGAAADSVVVSRLRYDEAGRHVSGTRASPIRWSVGASTRVRDIGWSSPTTVAVLDQVSPAQAEVRLLDVDGSMWPAEVQPTTVRGRVLGLATYPDSQTPFAIQPDELFNLAQVDTTLQQPVPGLDHITFAG